MEEWTRAQGLLGQVGLEKLKNARVAVFGIGGVGGHAAEGLARCGVGELHFIDGDSVASSNLNRQIVALRSTLGKNKAEVMASRVMDINPACNVKAFSVFLKEDTLNLFDFSSYDYIVDAVDDVSAKLLLIKTAQEKGVKIISSMGAGNKLNPTAFRVSDIYKTSVCPLARVMRRELKKIGVEKLKVVWSDEEPIASEIEDGKRVPASVSFVPSVAGLILAGEVVKDLIKE
ncbi:MAG: tRNA threonylcarbamoyladenosine dehydratase [Clostridia bacterium]|nr:tRNA threonylcarbamoyladenosine dehydratase [Clostridia bacterium]